MVRAYLPRDRFCVMNDLIDQIMHNPWATVKTCLSLLGIWLPAFVTPFSRHHLYCLYVWLQTVCSPTKHSIEYHSNNSFQSNVISVVEGSMCGCSLPVPITRQDDYYIRLHLRLGRSQGEPYCTGQLDISRGKDTSQLSITSGSLRNLQVLSAI